jgi:hypothetical protein
MSLGDRPAKDGSSRRRAIETGARFALAAFLAVAACACSNKLPDIQENIYPNDYKAQIMLLLRNTLDDPTNIREALVAQPTMKAIQPAARYVACLRYNAKDRTGQYAGVKERAAYFFAGRITQIVDAGEICANSNYELFPELQRM